MLKALGLPKLSNKSSLKGPEGELEAESCFQRQSCTKHLGQTLVFMRNSALREKFNSFFQEFFASIDKTFILGHRLGTRL